MKPNELLSRVKAELRTRYNGQLDPNQDGYTRDWRDNLLPGIDPQQVQSDLDHGAGQELRFKFRALHSSSALAVNTFGPFKTQPQNFIFGDQSGFQPPRFEQRFPTGLGGVPPTLDVWLQGENEVVAIESKFLEYVSAKKAVYSDRYTRDNLPQVDDAWWKVLETSRASDKQHLDVAQLMKHALGLLRYQQAHPTLNVKLVYLFWEPTNAAHVDICQEHRRQIQTLINQVSNSKLPLEALSYVDLWDSWRTVPVLNPHLERLERRYRFSVSV